MYAFEDHMNVINDHYQTLMGRYKVLEHEDCSYFKKIARKEGFCAKCRSGENTIPILWGLPADLNAVVKKAEEGKLVLGGCIVSSDSPRWRCTKCRYET